MHMQNLFDLNLGYEEVKIGKKEGYYAIFC